MYDLSATPFFLRGSGYDEGTLFPPLMKIRDVSARIAGAVVEVAIAEGVATRDLGPRPMEAIRAAMYEPRY